VCESGPARYSYLVASGDESVNRGSVKLRVKDNIVLLYQFEQLFQGGDIFPLRAVPDKHAKGCIVGTETAALHLDQDLTHAPHGGRIHVGKAAEHDVVLCQTQDPV
jgi:hypothetical protein